MTGPITHIIGAGMSGLSAAVSLIKTGHRVVVHESAGHAGGRCRSFQDDAMGCRIDNGNHLLLGGNRAAHAYLKDIGAEASLTGPERAEFHFLDLKTAERWTVTLDAGFLPKAVFSKAGRVPGSRPLDYLKAFRLAWAGGETTVAQCLGPDNALFRRFWEPISVAILNTAAEEGAASLLSTVMRETLFRGQAACRPLIAKRGLSDSFVDPAVRFLEGRGADFRLNNRLRGLNIEDGRVAGLDFGDRPAALDDGDTVVLAVPPPAAAGLVSGLEVPGEFRAIVNGHFRLERKIEGFSFLGLSGGLGQWLFVRGGVASVTVSAADDLAEEDNASIAGRLWADVALALGLGDVPLPPHRIVKEKRATFAQTPEQEKRRPGARTGLKNLFLAGDWTATGLPATIEGSIRSGRTAADMVLSFRS
ncbi:MAG: FAD-dependent oxidoreductase [Proteobacteria bacterium]|nr:FAD-dependent oxidoreductase [Pseudomonadota bacterium]